MNKLARVLGKAALFLGAMTLVAGASYVGAVTAGLTVGNPLFTAPVMACGQQSQSCPAPVAGGTSPTYTWTANANGAITINGQNAFDVSIYDSGYAYVFVASAGTGGSIAGKTQDSLGNALNANFLRNDVCGVPAGALTYGGNWWQTPLRGQFFTLTLSGLTAGSAAGTIYFSKTQQPFCPPTVTAPPSFVPGQTSIPANTATTLVSGRFGPPTVGRVSLLVTGGSADAFCASNTGTTVTLTNGWRVPANSLVQLPTQSGVSCISASSIVMTYTELF